jgi:hypothetical protein
MPLKEKPNKVPLFIRLIFGAYAAGGLALIYYEARRALPEIWTEVTTVAYFAGALTLIKITGVRALLGYAPRTGVAAASIADALRFIACGVGCVLVGIPVIKILPDNRLTATIVLILILGCASLGGFFLARMIWRLVRPR